MDTIKIFRGETIQTFYRYPFSCYEKKASSITTLIAKLKQLSYRAPNYGVLTATILLLPRGPLCTLHNMATALSDGFVD